MMRKHKVLIVEDEEILRVTLCDDLQDAGFEVVTVSDSDSALLLLQSQRWDAIVTDLRLPGSIDGIQILERAKVIDPSVSIIVMTAFATVNSAVEAMKKGADDYLTKPFESEELVMVLNRAVRVRTLERENLELRERLTRHLQFQNLIGVSPRMQEIFKKLAIVAPTDETVIIFGETGTGKERIAGTIHENSSRRAGPFIAVSCAALTHALLESELFGYEKGAFTGADNRKLGRFERASGGTLFLDEIDDIPINLQVKLLRVLQEKEFERVGGTETIKTDIRIIAATQSDLRKKIDDGTFREDLYYRLNVLPINLPPLRERKADIPLFVEHYLEEFCPPERNIGVEPSTLQLLTDYSWPGNIRELKHLIKRLIVMGECKDITADMLPDEIREGTGSSDADGYDDLSFDDAVSKLERSLIMRALEDSGGNKSKAAALLNIAPTTFRDKLSKHQI